MDVFCAWLFLSPSSARVEVEWICLWSERSSAAQGVEGLDVEVFPGVGGAELEQYAAHADSYDGADFEQLHADRIHLRLGLGGTFQSQPPQRFDQRVSQCGEVETQLVAFHFVGREPVGEQAHLLLDAVLHLSPAAVELLV